MTIENAGGLTDALPALPGVYCFLRDDGECLYVGKAIHLKKRVKSYFQKAAPSPRIQLMLREATRLETTVTASEGEALLLENNMIKSRKPRYNILFRDDKSYPFVRLSRHPYPRLMFYRGDAKKEEADYFGPFPNSDAVKDTIDILQKVFQLRTCADSVLASRSRPCLLHAIGRCSAPCVNKIPPADYAATVEQARQLLSNGASLVVEQLQSKMADAVSKLRYEQAAVYRDQLKSLATIRGQYFNDEHESVNVDYIGVYCGGAQACVAVAMTRGGRRIGEQKWFPANVSGADATAVGDAFLTQHYLDLNLAPDKIYVNDVSDDWQASLPHLRGRLLRRPTGIAQTRIREAEYNARQAVTLQNSQQQARQDKLQLLAKRLRLAAAPARMECFDISHSGGEETIASKVVFDGGAPSRGDYRLFRIRDAKAGDDYAAIREAVTRSFRRALAGETPMADVVFIDGGVGQLGAARAALEALDAPADKLPPLFGVAKGAARKAGDETIIAADGEVIDLPPTDAALHLIQYIRDEAHRFAITSHRRRRDKKRARTSALDGVDGLGAAKRKRVMSYFGGLAALRAASAKDLAQVDGIGAQLAARIYQQLHR